jgi:hypothetical protein
VPDDYFHFSLTVMAVVSWAANIIVLPATNNQPSYLEEAERFTSSVELFHHREAWHRHSQRHLPSLCEKLLSASIQLEKNEFT